MSHILHILKRPLFWFVLFILFDFTGKIQNPDYLKRVVRSDGRGYYAYLPALLVYNDPSFQSCTAKELGYAPFDGDPLYLFKTEEGKTYNKYFPGAAIMNLPFFGLACAYSYLMQLPIDGYSPIFSMGILLANLVYALLALFLIRRFLKKLVPQASLTLDLLVILTYFTTGLIFYGLDTPSFTHHLSFLLFVLFANWGVNRHRSDPKSKDWFALGALLGLIFILRPPNVMVLLILPYILGSFERTKELLVQLFSEKAKSLWVVLFGFLLCISPLFILWHWQTGHWVVWSYSGEGFDFLHPKIWQALFSFRIGLFLHSPIYILVVVGLVLMLICNRFRVGAYLLYFSILLYVTFSWWCWDYESPYAVRPLVEHSVFLLLPFYALVDWQGRSKWLWVALVLVCGFSGIRYFTFSNGLVPTQRFTATSYFTTLQFWKAENKRRFNFNLCCPPHGNKIGQQNLFFKGEETTITSTDEFALTCSAKLKLPRTNERYYVRVSLEKKQNNSFFNEVYLVVDATSKVQKNRFYQVQSLYDDRLEGKEDWAKVQFQSIIYDNLQAFDEVKIYIWNKGQKSLSVRNYEVVLEQY